MCFTISTLTLLVLPATLVDAQAWCHRRL